MSNDNKECIMEVRGTQGLRAKVNIAMALAWDTLD